MPYGIFRILVTCKRFPSPGTGTGNVCKCGSFTKAALVIQTFRGHTNLDPDEKF